MKDEPFRKDVLYTASDTMRRLALYLHYLQKLPQGITAITPGQIAESLFLDPKLVRQDMKALLHKASVGEENREALYAAIARHAEVRGMKSVVLVGVGKLGSALMSYAGFSIYDLDILAGFDIDPKTIKKGAFGKPVYQVDKLKIICQRLNAKTGIITTPGDCAQAVGEALVNCGIMAIWNFTSARLKLPPHILVHNENLSATLYALAEYAGIHE